MAKQNGKTTEDLTFEQALERLETIVDQLESGRPTLEECMALFEEGMALKKLCIDKLDAAENTIKQLVIAASGEVTEVAFEGTA